MMSAVCLPTPEGIRSQMPQQTGPADVALESADKPLLNAAGFLSLSPIFYQLVSDQAFR
jgi:hypothetical protein